MQIRVTAHRRLTVSAGALVYKFHRYIPACVRTYISNLQTHPTNSNRERIAFQSANIHARKIHTRNQWYYLRLSTLLASKAIRFRHAAAAINNFEITYIQYRSKVFTVKCITYENRKIVALAKITKICVDEQKYLQILNLKTFYYRYFNNSYIIYYIIFYYRCFNNSMNIGKTDRRKKLI